MNKMTDNRPPQRLIVRLILPLIILGMVAFGVYWQHPDQWLGNRMPALPTPPAERIDPRPTPHQPVSGTIPLINGKASMRFASNRRDQPYDQWQQGNHFPKNEVYLISTLLDLSYPAATEEYKFQLDFTYYKDGTVFGTCTANVVIPVSESGMVQVCGFGWDQPGLFPVGPYYVEVLYAGEVVANGGFEIDD